MAIDGPASIPIEIDLPCAGCKYNLRGLTTDGRCPECGAAVLATIYDDLSPDDELAAIRRELVLAPLRSVSRVANVMPDATLLVYEAVQWSAYELRGKIGA